MLQGKIYDISRGHKVIIQLSGGKALLYVWVQEAARGSRKVRVTLLKSTMCWSLAEAGEDC